MSKTTTTLICERCGQLVLTADALNNGICGLCADVERHTCVHCGQYVNDLETMRETVDGDHICADCAEPGGDYAECEDCHEYFRIVDGHGHIDEYGTTLCEDCYDNGCYNTCDQCGRISADGEGVWCEDNQEVYCEDCAERFLYCCDNCGEWHTESGAYHDDTGITICNNCFERYCYTTCNDCGRILSEGEAHYSEEDGCDYCQDCFEDHQPEAGDIHDYSYKPTPLFHKTTLETTAHPLYFGVELEQSHNSRSDLADNLEAFEETFGTDEETWYLKQDSSLRSGFEMVSHPRTLASWHELAEDIESYFDDASKYSIAGRDGLHIHISKRAMSVPHMVRFGSFFATEQDNIIPIARRNSKEWAKYHDKPKTGNDCRDTLNHRSRYQAVNWCNRNTVEIRIFRSTTDIREFFAAIEFCHAAYLFTKRAVSIQQIVNGESWPLFLAFIRQDKRYRNLVVFLKETYGKQKDAFSTYIQTLSSKPCRKRCYCHKAQAA